MYSIKNNVVTPNAAIAKAYCIIGNAGIICMWLKRVLCIEIKHYSTDFDCKLQFLVSRLNYFLCLIGILCNAIIDLSLSRHFPT